MELRPSLASMLTALAVLAVPVASIHSQAPDPIRPAAEAGASKDHDFASDEAPEDAAQPTTAEASPESRSKSAGPSAERKQVLENRLKKKMSLKEKKALKQRDAAFRETQLQMQRMWMQMQVMLRQAEIELQVARLQAARMEGIERREAQERMSQLEIAASAARATEFQQEREYMLARDDPEQYRRFQQDLIEAQYAQQQAIQALAQTLRERQAGQGGSLANSPPPSAGTPGSTSRPQGPTGQPPMRSNPGAVVPMPSPPAPPQNQGSLADKDKRDQDAMRRRYP